jgi:hypothetical protein
MKTNPLMLLMKLGIIMIVLIFIIYLFTGLALGWEALLLIEVIIIIAIIGATIISFATPFYNKSWFQSNKWFGLVIGFWILVIIRLAIFLWPIFIDFLPNHSFTRYQNINGNRIKIVTEFYNEDNAPKIKKIWKNGKKDSTWTTFAKDGTIIKEELYRNDTLISNK